MSCKTLLKSLIQSLHRPLAGSYILHVPVCRGDRPQEPAWQALRQEIEDVLKEAQQQGRNQVTTALLVQHNTYLKVEEQCYSLWIIAHQRQGSRWVGWQPFQAVGCAVLGYSHKQLDALRAGHVKEEVGAPGMALDLMRYEGYQRAASDWLHQTRLLNPTVQKGQMVPYFLACGEDGRHTWGPLVVEHEAHPFPQGVPGAELLQAASCWYNAHWGDPNTPIEDEEHPQGCFRRPVRYFKDSECHFPRNLHHFPLVLPAYVPVGERLEQQKEAKLFRGELPELKATQASTWDRATQWGGRVLGAGRSTVGGLWSGSRWLYQRAMPSWLQAGQSSVEQEVNTHEQGHAVRTSSQVR